jgi:putative ATP-binding cassette transporter
LQLLEHTYRHFNKVFCRDLIRLVKPFWQSSEKKKAYTYLMINLFCSFGGVYVSVALNGTQKTLVDALTNFNKPQLMWALAQYLGLAVMVSFLTGICSYASGLLCIRWQKWLNNEYLSGWLKQQTHYKIQHLSMKLDNPDQRITEDLEAFAALTIHIFFLMINAITSFISFSVVLWGLSSVLSFAVWGHRLSIPGYLFFAATIYGMVGLWLVGLIGKKLSGLDNQQQLFNADFRTHLLRIREFSEQIALYKGEAVEKIYLDSLFSRVVSNFMVRNSLRKNLIFFSTGFEILTQIMGLFLAIPLFLARKVQMGGMMQISGAFVAVVNSFSRMIGAYSTIAEWKAVIFRLTEFQQALSQASSLEAQQLNVKQNEGALKFKNYHLYTPDARRLISIDDMSFLPGRRYLISGRSGVGKSSFFRSLLGVMPYVSGELEIPASEHLFMLPQRTYIPFGKLRDVLTYPQNNVLNDKTLIELLTLCGLGEWCSSLDIEKNWSQVLSLGQQQLVGFIRLFLTEAKWVLLDESTSALDEASEEKMYHLLYEYFPEACIMTIGHRQSLLPYHHERIHFNEDGQLVRLELLTTS